ncbi:MAG: periplasmic protein TonB, links inner and outer rane [Betaproteobacteria bacterium]|nr:periplasmic protein TonB, links inner and outer rane [Betaproteobacteria bacterium]
MMAAAELPFQPHNDRGSIRAFVLAAVVHGLLFAFLYFGISWTSQPAAPAQAELWASLPPMAQPRVVPPPVVKPEPPKPVVEEPKPEPPPPVKADIVQKIEKKKPEPVKPPPKKEEPKKEPPKKAEPPRPVPKPEEKQPDPLASEMERMKRELSKDTAQNDIKQALSKEGQQKAVPGSSGSSNTWTSKVGALVRAKVPISIANAVPGNPTAIFEVTVLPGREVGLVKLVKSSGYPAYDEAAQHAIEATSPLPPPTPGMGEIPRLLRYEATPKDK